jgi:TonB family protein
MVQITRIVLIFFVTVNSISAQNFDFKNSGFAKKYKEFFENEAELLFVNYYQSLERLGNSFILKTYNPDKLILTRLETYKDFHTTIKEGKYIEWYDNGIVWESGNYKNGKKVGVWEFHDFGTNTLEYGEFQNGKEEGRWIVKDSLGRKIIQYDCISGKFEGKYIRYDTLGNEFHIKNYQNDELVSEVIIDTLSYLKISNKVDQLPMLKECSLIKDSLEREECVGINYTKYIYSNISYPKKAIKYNVEGKAVIYFQIDKNGNVKDIKVIRGICKEIEEECIRIIKKSPEWSPGIKNGVPIKASFNQPINFKLE